MQEFEKNIIKKAVEKFNIETGLYYTINFDADNTELELALKEGYKITFHVECRRTIAKEKIGIIKEQLDRVIKENTILVTQYINPIIMETIKELGINTIDMAGNAFINHPPVYIYIKGNKTYKPIQLVNPGKAYNPAGLQVIFALLCYPNLIHEPYRKIAARAKTAVGTVHAVINELEDTGFIIDKGKNGKILTKKEELLRKWVTYYPEKLRPKFFIGRYKIGNKNWREMNILEGLWGAEPAAAEYTTYIKPNLYTIYAEDKINELILRNRMKPDVNGNVELYYQFWLQNKTDTRKTVDPILIYADLLASGDQRNIETAKILYEQEIAGHLKED